MCQASAAQVAILASSQTQQIIQLNSKIQSQLLALNMTSPVKNIITQAVSKGQLLSSNATILIMQASSQAQNATSLAASQVFQQFALLADMRKATNSTLQPVANLQLTQNLTYQIQQSISFSQSQVSIQAAAFTYASNSLASALGTDSQIQILYTIVSQTVSYDLNSFLNIQSLLGLVSNMEEISLNLTSSLNVTLLLALEMQQAVVQANRALTIALQAAIKAARLALCYPNPCQHGGMCTANYDNVSFTCFCSANYNGPTCQSLKGASIFSTGKGLRSFEKMIRIDDDFSENFTKMLVLIKKDENILFKLLQKF